ncbi:ferredoxin-nitrite reductase [Hydrogenimonas sp.]|nr:ferredoxin-nitrite reductase [Hydrogenimonas sp.]
MKETKINKIERLKLSLKPYDYYTERIDRLDADDLEEADRFYLKNFGIFNHKLRPENFILRVRIPAGRLKRDTLESLMKMAVAADSRVILTTRAQIELHDLDLKRALDYSREIERLGLTSWQTFTDNIRNIVTDPLDGIGRGCKIEVYRTVLQMQELFLKKREFTGMLPRKFNVAISGMENDMFPFCGNDLFFALAEKEGEYGFNVYAGGKNSDIAEDLNIFCRLEDVTPLFRAVVVLYMQKGPRGSRTKTRLFHMLQNIGVEKFRGELESIYGKGLHGRGVRLSAKAVPHEKIELKEGGYAHRYLSRFGEISREQAEEISDICRSYGVEEVRLGCDQNIYIPGLPESVEFRRSYRRYAGITACAGSRYCVYSLFDTKEESSRIESGILQKNAITLGYSGCLKGCARHAFSDIGFVGIRTGLYTEGTERGIRLYLGAEYTSGKRAGRLILYAVPLRCVNSMTELLVALFERSGYGCFEEFAAEVLNLYSREAVAFWLLLNYYRRHVAKEGGLFMLPAKRFEDEKDSIAKLMEEEAVAADEEVLQRVRAEEEFPFREAIIFLEKAAFAVR